MSPPKYPLWRQFISDAVIVFVVVALIVLLWLATTSEYRPPGTLD
jgi:hypothetical protein